MNHDPDDKIVLLAERDELKAKLAEVGNWERLARKRGEELSAANVQVAMLRFKLDASKRTAAEMRVVLEDTKHYVLNLPLEGTINMATRIDTALSSDAGRDYVHRSEVDAARRQGMREAAMIARRLEPDEAHNAPHNVITEREILAACDASKEGGK